MIFQTTTFAFIELAFYIVLCTIILVGLIVIVVIQLGYQIKVGRVQIIGGARPRRVIATVFGYEIVSGGRWEAEKRKDGMVEADNP